METKTEYQEKLDVIFEMIENSKSKLRDNAFFPLILGGMCCWIIALGAFFLKEDYMLLMVALSIIIAYLIPGYLLRSAK